MMPGSFRGGRIGACTDCRNNWAAFRAGEIDIEDISALNEELAPTVSLCHFWGGGALTYTKLDRPELVALWALQAQLPV